MLQGIVYYVIKYVLLLSISLEYRTFLGSSSSVMTFPVRHVNFKMTVEFSLLTFCCYLVE
jgi:hypothetical protein